jgi:hypothetical protein
MNCPAISFVLGVALALAGATLAVVCRRKAPHVAAFAPLWSRWLLGVALLGAPLSYVPWPVVFTDVQPGPTTLQWVGMPAPMVAQRTYRDRHLLDPALVIFAVILNGAFASGVAHGLLYLHCRRRARLVEDG